MYSMLLSAGEPRPLPSQNEDIPDHDPNPPQLSLAPPPPGEFNSREELLEYLKDWCKNQGFAVVIGRSRVNRLWIKCDRGGEYADKHLNDPENRKRKRKATRLTGCPFHVKASMKKDQIWRCHTENPNHNHPPSEDLSVHPSIRRLTGDQLAKLNEMTEAGRTPTETLEELQRLWPGITVLKRDIYNARKKYKTEKEVREAEEGSESQQPHEDPNGKIPGPTPTGRWEWIEEGDEVKRKKKKGKSASIAHDSSTTGMDTHDEDASPQQTHMTLPTQSLQSHRPSNNMGGMTLPYQQHGLSPQLTSSRIPETDFNPTLQTTPNPYHTTRPFRHYQNTNPQNMPHRSYTSTPNNANTDPMLQSTIPARGRASDMTAMTSMMTPMMQATSAASQPILTPTAKPAPPSGQVLMSRIERMEKEQNEQKNMLAQILSAVQGVGTGLRR